MSKSIEPIYFLILFTCFSSAWFVTLVYSPVHKYFRNQKTFTSLLILACAMLIISCFLIKPDWEDFQKINALSPIISISYLLLYKVANKISMTKYGRQIYFSCRLSSWREDEESQEQTALELFMQFLILVISMSLWWFFGAILFGKGI